MLLHSAPTHRRRNEGGQADRPPNNLCGAYFAFAAPPPKKKNLSKLTYQSYLGRGIDSVFYLQLNLVNEIDFNPLHIKSKNKQPSSGTAKTLSSVDLNLSV